MTKVEGFDANPPPNASVDDAKSWVAIFGFKGPGTLSELPADVLSFIRSHTWPSPKENEFQISKFEIRVNEPFVSTMFEKLILDAFKEYKRAKINYRTFYAHGVYTYEITVCFRYERL